MQSVHHSCIPSSHPQPPCDINAVSTLTVEEPFRHVLDGSVMNSNVPASAPRNDNVFILPNPIAYVHGGSDLMLDSSEAQLMSRMTEIEKRRYRVRRSIERKKASNRSTFNWSKKCRRMPRISNESVIISSVNAPVKMSLRYKNMLSRFRRERGSLFSVKKPVLPMRKSLRLQSRSRLNNSLSIDVASHPLCHGVEETVPCHNILIRRPSRKPSCVVDFGIKSMPQRRDALSQSSKSSFVDEVWRCLKCQFDNPRKNYPYCSVCSYSFLKRRLRSSVSIGVLQFKKRRLEEKFNFASFLTEVEGEEASSRIASETSSYDPVDFTDGPPIGFGRWVMEEKSLVRCVRQNNLRHASGYVNSLKKTPESLVEESNKSFIMGLCDDEECVTSLRDYLRLYMVFFRVKNVDKVTSRFVMKNINLMDQEVHRKYLTKQCVAVRRCDPQMYFMRKLDKTIHVEVGSSSFEKLKASMPHTVWREMNSLSDFYFDPTKCDMPSVANTDAVTICNGTVSLLSFVRNAFMNGSQAFAMLGKHYPNYQSQFHGVAGFSVHVNELYRLKMSNKKRSCRQFHWGKTPNQGHMWRKTSRVSSRCVGDMACMDSYTPELMLFLSFMMVTETWLFKQSSLFKNANVEDLVWAYCESRYVEARKSLYERLLGCTCRKEFCLADAGSFVLGGGVKSPHTDVLNDASPGQDGTTCLSFCVDVLKECKLDYDVKQQMVHDGISLNCFSVQSIIYTRSMVGFMAMKNQIDFSSTHPIIHELLKVVRPDIVDRLRDLEWIDDIVLHDGKLRNFYSMFRLGNTADWPGWSVCVDERWSRDFFLGSILSIVLEFIFNHKSIMNYRFVRQIALFIMHDINGQPLCHLIFSRMARLTTKELSRRLSLVFNNMYCVLCDFSREAKPSLTDPLNMPCSSSNRFRASNAAASLYRTTSDKRKVEEAENDFESALQILRNGKHSTTLQMLNTGDEYLDFVQTSSKLIGVSHLRGIFGCQISAGLSLVPDSFWNYASVTNSLGPHKFFTKVMGYPPDKMQMKSLFRSSVKLMLDIQPRVGEDPKGIENIFCLLSKVRESGESTSSKEFIFAGSGTEQNELVDDSFDPSTIQNFFRLRPRRKTMHSELEVLFKKKWQPLRGAFRFFWEQEVLSDSTQFVAGWDRDYVRERHDSCPSSIRCKSLDWCLFVGKKYPRNPFDT